MAKGIQVLTLTNITLGDYDDLTVDQITDIFAEAFAEEAPHVAEQYLDD